MVFSAKQPLEDGIQVPIYFTNFFDVFFLNTYELLLKFASLLINFSHEMKIKDFQGHYYVRPAFFYLVKACCFMGTDEDHLPLSGK